MSSIEGFWSRLWDGTQAVLGARVLIYTNTPAIGRVVYYCVMALNIKNRQAEEEVTKLAELTGESKAEAVRVAAKERRDRLAKAEGEHRAQLKRRLARIQAAWRRSEGLSQDELYDSVGLPK
jgi:hypothetical protein